MQSSASLLLALSNDAHATLGEALSPADVESAMHDGNEARSWQRFGRILLRRQKNSLIVEDGFLSSHESWASTHFSFMARAPEHVEQVQIWAGIRCHDRSRRYVFGLRGGNNDDIYIARYAPDGGIRFLGIAPLDFHPVPGAWYELRAVAHGNRFQIYLNQEELPRINVEDAEPLWADGGVSIGGGWLPAEFRDVQARTLTQDEIARFEQAEDKVYTFGQFDREQKRAHQRANYKRMQVQPLEPLRQEISLNGDWLFSPDQELTRGGHPEVIEYDDAKWHVMEVPNFWTLTLTWLHAETGFPNLPGASAGKGLSDRLYESELKRLDGYTFLWKETRSAWYRHHIDLPQNIIGRHVELCFDAVAKACEVWVNGNRVGAHVGMFGEVRCDVTSAVKPGANLVAVHVRGQLDTQESSTEVVGIAVTVPVTASMLHSLPHGMYPETASGIWQGVRLEVTHPVAVEDVFLEPKLDGLSFQLKLRNTSSKSLNVSIRYSIRSIKDGTVLHADTQKSVREVSTAGASFDFATPVLKPELWSPQTPNLYSLDIEVSIDGSVIDRQSTRFGFRTFRVDGNRLLLNDKPFWLRGCNHFPHALRPNDAVLARRFMQLAREGNVVATRTHTAPFTSTWLEAADENGMCVSFEGTWPWLMLQGEPPDETLLKVWKEEFASLIRKHRNHPSVILWTVNNEMKFEAFDRKNPALLKKKWIILSDMVKTIRSIDPTRPVVCDSSYCREEVASEYENLIRPEGFDDGDIDDAHRYYGWYNPTFFHFMHGEFGKAAWPGRPLISQEMATGYPRNDDGHPTRFYLFQHFTPQSLVGEEAYENRDPAIFLKRQSFLTKELAEVFRRTNRETCAGIFHFAYITWFQNPWDAEKIRPWSTWHEIKKALQPILVSAELYGRHFYAGQQIRTRVCIANDAEDGHPLPPCTLAWSLRNGHRVIAEGKQPVAAVPYYANAWLDLSIPIPEALPSAKVNASLHVELRNRDQVLSANDYDILLAMQEWAFPKMIAAKEIALFDPGNVVSGLFESLNAQRIASLHQANLDKPLVIAGASQALRDSQTAQSLQTIVETGGKVLLLNPGDCLAELYPSQVRRYRAAQGEIVGMQVSESRVFSEIEPLDLSWFNQGTGNLPLACSGVYQVDSSRAEITALAQAVEIHGYLQKPEDVIHVSGSPLVELRVGSGLLIASEMMLEAGTRDPIAGRLLANLIGAL